MKKIIYNFLLPEKANEDFSPRYSEIVSKVYSHYDNFFDTYFKDPGLGVVICLRCLYFRHKPTFYVFVEEDDSWRNIKSGMCPKKWSTMRQRILESISLWVTRDVLED